MHRLRPALLTAFWLALLPAVGWAAELVSLPALTARITDLTATLDPTQRGRLEAQLAAIERNRGAQVAVLILPSTQPEAIEQFGIRLAEAWKIGHKGADNGVIVIVAKDDRKMRIEVGYGLEGAIPDAIASRIIRERMAPRFKQGDFFGGIAEALTTLEAALGGETPPAATGGTASSAAASGDWGTMPWLMALLMFSGLARKLFGVIGALAISGFGAWLAYSAFASLPLAVAAALLVFLLSFARFGGTGTGGWSSGGGSSSGGGFSGGGFSGGGGSFGGGGASGDW